MLRSSDHLLEVQREFMNQKKHIIGGSELLIVAVPTTAADEIKEEQDMYLGNLYSYL